MEIKRKILKLTLTIIIVVLLLNTPINHVESDIPNEPHRADAMWIEPPLINATGLTVGYKFNVTVWINLTQECAGWQFYMLYDKGLLNATRCGYTAGDKSDFFKNITTIPVSPTLDGPHNKTHAYVLHGESWLMGDFRSPGYGSLAWVEFEIIAEPPFTCILDISSEHHPPTSKTYALNPQQEEIPLLTYDTTVIPEFSSWLAVIFLSLTLFAALLTAKRKK